MKVTIIAGNPIEGFECYGVFDTGTEALEWANQDPHLPKEWWLIRINPVS